MRFKVGDVAHVIYIRNGNSSSWAPGVEVEIVGVGPFPSGFPHPQTGRQTIFPADYHVRLSNGEWAICLDEQLRSRYDGNELAKWEDCVWRPNKVVA